jgi:ribonuclease T1
VELWKRVTRSCAARIFTGLLVSALLAFPGEGHAEVQLPAVAALADLPPEARATVRLIREGGPFPFDRDGVVFGNRERLLPVRSRGYYREYTVVTPGVHHRGARRIIAGRQGELYYTDDHYRSFKRVRE